MTSPAGSTTPAISSRTRPSRATARRDSTTSGATPSSTSRCARTSSNASATGSPGHRTVPFSGCSDTTISRRCQSTASTFHAHPASRIRCASPAAPRFCSASGETVPISRRPATTRNSRSAVNVASRSMKCRRPNSFSAAGPMNTMPWSSTRNPAARRWSSTASPSSMTARSPHHFRHVAAPNRPSCNANAMNC